MQKCECFKIERPGAAASVDVIRFLVQIGYTLLLQAAVRYGTGCTGEILTHVHPALRARMASPAHQRWGYRWYCGLGYCETSARTPHGAAAKSTPIARLDSARLLLLVF